MAGLAACSGGGGSGGGERRFSYADAVEVPTPVTERDQLAAVLAGYAHRNGLGFEDSSPRAQRHSDGEQTLAFKIERPLTNGRLWTEVQVSAVGNGPALITFARPLDRGIEADADAGRAEVLGELRQRWPGTAKVPVLPDGGIPRQGDLRHTPDGLRIARAAAARYRLPADSPLLAP